ncbi:MAG: helix-turn-helix domain-containing protein [Eubacteriales bacterium]
MHPEEINPYIRQAQIQAAILEGNGERMAYDYRLFYILAGNGEIVIENNAFGIQENSLIFLPPEIGYYFSGKMRVAVLNFDISRNADTKSKPICPPPRREFDPTLIFDTERCDALSKPLVLFGKIEMREKILELVYEWNSGEEWRDAATSAELKMMLIAVLKEKIYKNAPEKQLCDRVSGYIKLHATEIRDNKELALKFGYHAVYLGEVFKNRTGKTLHEEIVLQKVALAKRYLEQTAFSVEEIAEAVNFSSRAYFCTVFKKYTKMTPLAYRKMHERNAKE